MSSHGRRYGRRATGRAHAGPRRRGLRTGGLGKAYAVPVARPPIDRLGVGDLMTLWAEEPATPMHIALAGLLDPGPLLDGGPPRIGERRLHDLRQAVAARLDRAPALRRRLRPTRPGQGRPIWVDDESFDISRHVEAVQLPDGNLADFLSWAGTAAVRPLDRRYPLWRLTIVGGLAGGEIGILLVVHHAVADGMAGAALAAALLDTVPGQPPGPSTWSPEPGPTPLALAVDALHSRLRSLRQLGRGRGAGRRDDGPRDGRRRGSARAAWQDLRATFAAVRQTAPDLALPRPLGPARQVVAVTWALADIRAAAHAHQATINDVMLVAAAAGVRRILTGRGCPTAGLEVRVSVPVAAPPGQRNAGGTLPLVVNVPVDLTDPVVVLSVVRARTGAAKGSRDRSYPGLLSGPLVPITLARISLRWLRRHGARRINFYLTNVPGPGTSLWLDGAHLRAACPIAPLVAGVPLAVAVLSYDADLTMTVNACADLELDGFADAADAAVRRLRCGGHRDDAPESGAVPGSVPAGPGRTSGR